MYGQKYTFVLFEESFELLKLIHKSDTFISNMGNSDASCTL